MIRAIKTVDQLIPGDVIKWHGVMGEASGVVVAHQGGTAYEIDQLYKHARSWTVVFDLDDEFVCLTSDPRAVPQEHAYCYGDYMQGKPCSCGGKLLPTGRKPGRQSASLREREGVTCTRSS